MKKLLPFILLGIVGNIALFTDKVPVRFVSITALVTLSYSIGLRER